MHKGTLAQLAGDLRARRVSATELTRHFLGRIERFDSKLNAFITVTAEQAMAQAREAEVEVQRGRWRGGEPTVPEWIDQASR